MPPALGIYTRLTGWALNGSAGCCTLSTSASLASGESTTSPSTPAVRRPALRSVTRRTLTSVLERDQSINLCNRRTLERSPAFDAVKIRWRNRHTSRFTRHQSTWCQPQRTPSGPLTAATTAVAVSSLSVGSGDRVIFFLTGSPDHVSPLSRSGHPGPGIRPVMRDHQQEGADRLAAVSRRVSAAGIRFLVILRPPERSAFLTVSPPPRPQARRTRTGFPRSARTRHDRGGRPL